MSVFGAAGARAVRLRSVRRAGAMLAARRGRGLVLVFHRLVESAASARGIVPAVPEPLFRRHLEALLGIGDIVPLTDLLTASPRAHRPRFAVTLDDDWSSHHALALPALRRLGVPATFFLSGRSLHGIGPLWFERLDAYVAAAGVRAAAASLDLDTADPERLASWCETSAERQRRIERMALDAVPHLDAAGMKALADGGMTIGFHTVCHQALPLLADTDVDRAVTWGRAELERATGTSIRLFAYPHGKACPRAAARVAAAGFTAAFTGRPVALRPADDRYLLGRWEPGTIDADRLVAGALARLHGWRGQS